MGILIDKVTEIEMNKTESTSRRIRVCPICDKAYIPCGRHQYKVNKVLVCSYNCQIKAEKENPKKEYNKINKWR